MSKPSLKYRMHEWLAERISWVQYPSISNMDAVPFFKHQMPFWKQYLLIVFGLAGLALSVILAFFIGLIFWAIITA